MIDLQNEKVVRLQRVPKLLPPNERTGRPIHISAIYRWVQAGRMSVNGQRVRLETIKVGGSTLTSMEALQRFADRLSEPEGESENCTSESNTARAHVEVAQLLGLIGDRP